MEITRRLAEYIRDTEFDDIPADVKTKAKHCFLDWLGSGLGGVDDEASLLITDYVLSCGGKPEATIIGRADRTDAAHAALANGVIGHALDFDDYHADTVIHGTDACLPAIAAVAEKNGLSGADVLTALVLGVDVSIRVGLGLGPYHYERGWHSTATAGILGAGAAVSKLLRLDMDQTLNAMGMCGTQASGLRQVFGTMTKPLHPGKACMDAILSASLAQRGFTCSKDILEGDLGVLQVLTENYDAEKILEGLGSSYHILDVSFKPYPSCA
jgi:2-methylcitrate dehydratase PrpD